MSRPSVISAALILASFALHAAIAPRTFSVRADRIAADNVTKAAVLTGNVEAVSEPVHLKTDLATRDAEGVMHLHEPSSITTCTNHPGICHWALKGDVQYLDGKYVKGRNVWLEFYELPVFWLPCFYYPLEGECAFRIMPGYMSRWGAYVLTKTVYEIAGDPTHQDNTWWLHGNTRFDLRYENGIALGFAETRNHNLFRCLGGNASKSGYFVDFFDDFSNFFSVSFILGDFGRRIIGEPGLNNFARYNNFRFASIRVQCGADVHFFISVFFSPSSRYCHFDDFENRFFW